MTWWKNTMRAARVVAGTAFEVVVLGRRPGEAGDWAGAGVAVPAADTPRPAGGGGGQ
ncbi:hypothetical protein [Streptomyces sp. 7-21]|uniref:hypothetical protein n=1 Tax=Streptomyces sp. 7-21 TaxID=2802283 RepID=UPI00191DF55D|nr:hypothetical protein [Streptomyces sp. 7-21]MBL1067556.1 hypothetical protein [Streptomyces sp. 7-21]